MRHVNLCFFCLSFSFSRGLCIIKASLFHFNLLTTLFFYIQGRRFRMAMHLRDSTSTISDMVRFWFRRMLSFVLRASADVCARQSQQDTANTPGKTVVCMKGTLRKTSDGAEACLPGLMVQGLRVSLEFLHTATMRLSRY